MKSQNEQLITVTQTAVHSFLTSSCKMVRPWKHTEW